MINWLTQDKTRALYSNYCLRLYVKVKKSMKKRTKALEMEGEKVKRYRGKGKRIGKGKVDGKNGFAEKENGKGKRKM